MVPRLELLGFEVAPAATLRSSATVARQPAHHRSTEQPMTMTTYGDDRTGDSGQ